MASDTGTIKLKKELTLFGVFAVATGTTLSAAFLLPGLAFREAGPAVILSYFIAALMMIAPTLCKVELATAMPKAGGTYFFLDRSLGPLAGTVGGLGTWLALMLKAAFALVGMGAYITLVFKGAPIEAIAVALALAFGAVNFMGAKATTQFQIVMVIGLLVLMIWFMLQGTFSIDTSRFTGFFDKGSAGIFATAGMVFVSYVGVTKVASVAEEVENPQRNLPLGIFLGLGTAVFVYMVGLTVIVGVTPADELAQSLGVDWQQFKLDRESPEAYQRIESDRAEGIRARITGTPSFFLNGIQYRGPLGEDELRRVIRNTYKRKRTSR